MYDSNGPMPHPCNPAACLPASGPWCCVTSMDHEKTFYMCICKPCTPCIHSSRGSNPLYVRPSCETLQGATSPPSGASVVNCPCHVPTSFMSRELQHDSAPAMPPNPQPSTSKAPLLIRLV
mmetsp:Transcript_31814/g.70674  ORF Transcript_31814/g.70674 Transcript_31814/m.70674 type:complete len:121 (+) Transcript_31814:191-553(+)